MRVQPRKSKGKVQGFYSLQIESPQKKAKAIETFASMPAVVERAAELIQAGYNVGIWSPVSLEKH